MAKTIRAVTVIPPTINPQTKLPTSSTYRLRVAAYARVSTDSDEQFTSYEAQISYYTNYIMSHPEWEFVKVYTDEGISGTNIKHRDGFNEMIADALDGKIDLIVTKSVSRFARNTVDSLVTVRKLKEKGVEVFFEKENIYTLDSKGELLITIMSSLAQEESRSISENVTWGQRKRFADGKVSLPYKQFLGYRKGENGLPEIVPEEAAVVRQIYSLYMDGKTYCGIAKQLTEEGIPTPSGRKNWPTSTVVSILTNEKYKGDALLQKAFTVDFLTKKMKVNEGEVPQYYVENSHPAIINPQEWQMVQDEIQRRKALGGKYSGNSILAAKLVCGDCGEFYGSKVWHSNSKYRKVVWHCNRKFSGDKKCSTPTVDEERIKQGFVTAINQLLETKFIIMESCDIILATLTNSSKLNAEIEAVTQEMEVVVELTRRCVDENSRTAQDQNDYIERYNGYVSRYKALEYRLNQLQAKQTENTKRANALTTFIAGIQEVNGLTEFDEHLWRVALDRVVIYASGEMVYCFQNGALVTI